MPVRISLALVLAIGLAFGGKAAPVGAAPIDAAATAAIGAALAAINSGDGAAFARAFEADATILDEISPFAFRGRSAARAWFARLRDVNRANDITDERSVSAAAQHGSVEGDDAYAVVPVRITYRQHGRSIDENGAWTFAVRKTGGTWKIALAAFAPTTP